MSRIYKGEAAKQARNFQLADFTKASEVEAFRKTAEFVPDKEAPTGPPEFIPGGFDFDYKGGLRRDEILRRSMDEAEEIVSAARAQAGVIRDQARNEGYTQGHKDGYTAGLKAADPVMTTFQSLVKELMTARDVFYGQAEEEMAHLVINVAAAALGNEIEKNPALIRNVIRSAVRKLQAREDMIIHINPQDMAEAEKFRPELGKEVEDIDKVTFKGDPLITRGGCMLETNIGSIDARVETQLESMRESLLRAIEESKIENG
ncbi:MAG: hypothetical protein HY751_03585 [Nitrospinae bacterium]|nr:hypothetical protein [Nitrospinota bacterium]